MAERIINEYRRLFEIRLLHHYWLDEGKMVFDLIPEKEKRNKRLLSYDHRFLLTVSPTAATAKTITGLGGVYKNTALGCIVAVADSTVVPLDAMFEFIVTIRNPSFFNYTALTLRPQKIYELYHQPEDKTYRYKENVPVLSNLTGVSRGTEPDKTLFLSKEFPSLANDDKVEELILENDALKQLTGDQPDADAQLIYSPATDLPVFVHQGDVPDIIPPQGLDGAPARGITLTDDIDDNVFALLRLSPVRSDDEDFSLIDNSGHAKDAPPVYQIRFKSRSTVWRYLQKNTGEEIYSESKALPLTYFGNAGTQKKPSEGLVKAKKTPNNHFKIIRLVSEIYV